MKKVEFRKLYFNELRKRLEILDEKRKTVKEWIFSFGLILLSINGIVLFFSYKGDSYGFLIFSLLVTGTIAYFFYKFISEDFVKKYKNEIIRVIIKNINEDMNYSINGFVPKNEFIESRLFERMPEKYIGEDFVYGKIDKTNIKFSEIRSSSYVETKNGKSERVIFNGIFFLADFNKEINSFVVVKPDLAEKLFGDIGTSFQKLNTLGTVEKLIKMENSEFEKLFAVYGPNEIEARYILTPKLMEEIVNFRKKMNKNIHISFINSKIYIAINIEEDLFGPKIFSSIVKLEDVEKYFDILSGLIGIVEAFDLNTRIWTKE